MVENLGRDIAFMGCASTVLAGCALVGAVGGAYLGSCYGHPVIGCVVGMVSVPVAAASAYVGYLTAREKIRQWASN